MNYLPRLLQMMQLRQAVASLSLSHPESCDCDVCKAATGDDDAYARVLIAVEESSRTVSQEDQHV